MLTMMYVPLSSCCIFIILVETWLYDVFRMTWLFKFYMTLKGLLLSWMQFSCLIKFLFQNMHNTRLIWLCILCLFLCFKTCIIVCSVKPSWNFHHFSQSFLYIINTQDILKNYIKIITFLFDKLWYFINGND